MSIFNGIKVLDLTKVFSGPFATRILADYGAEVIKIESNNHQDDSRSYPPIKNGWSGYYEILNRNKIGLQIDLKKKKDLKKLYQLIKQADVFVENLTPSSKNKLKIDYQTLKKINPKIIYASLSGKGQSNDIRYYDVIAQAESGLMSLSGTKSQPMKIGPSVVDAFSGMSLAFAISSALFYRQLNGSGQYIDVSMLNCAFNLLEASLIEYSITGINPPRTCNQDNAIAPFGVYKACDGYIVIAAGNDSLWKKLLSFLKSYIAVDDSLFETNLKRLKNNSQLTGIIEQVLSRFSVDQIGEKLSQLGLPNSKVNNMSDVLCDENNYKSGGLVQIEHPKLGKVVVPGRAILFSQCDNIEYKNSPELNESTHDLTIGVSTLNRTSSGVGKPKTSQSLFYRDKD